MKALLESRFGLEMEKKDFDNMLRRVPLDKKGNVRYPEFLATFDAGRFDNKSLWEVGKNIFSRTIKLKSIIYINNGLSMRNRFNEPFQLILFVGAFPPP